MWKRIGAAAAAAVISATLVAGAADAANRSSVGQVVSCRADHSPGVVTHWEFHHATHGMTRHEVTCLYGVAGHTLRGFWASDGRFHEIVSYPSSVGRTTEVTYVDRHSTGSDYRLTRAFWYPKDAS